MSPKENHYGSAWPIGDLWLSQLGPGLVNASLISYSTISFVAPGPKAEGKRSLLVVTLLQDFEQIKQSHFSLCLCFVPYFGLTLKQYLYVLSLWCTLFQSKRFEKIPLLTLLGWKCPGLHSRHSSCGNYLGYVRKSKSKESSKSTDNILEQCKPPPIQLEGRQLSPHRIRSTGSSSASFRATSVALFPPGCNGRSPKGPSIGICPRQWVQCVSVLILRTLKLNIFGGWVP